MHIIPNYRIGISWYHSGDEKEIKIKTDILIASIHDQFDKSILCENQRLHLQYANKYWIQLHIISMHSIKHLPRSMLKGMGFDIQTISKVVNTDSKSKRNNDSISKSMKFARLSSKSSISLVAKSSDIKLMEYSIVDDLGEACLKSPEKEKGEQTSMEIADSMSALNFGGRDAWHLDHSIFTEQAINSVLKENVSREPILFYGFGGTAQSEWIKVLKWGKNIPVFAIVPMGFNGVDWINIFQQAINIAPCIVYLTDLDGCSNPNGISFGEGMDFNAFYRQIKQMINPYNQTQKRNEKNLPLLIDLITSYWMRQIFDNTTLSKSQPLANDIIEIIKDYNNIFKDKWVQIILNTCCPWKIKKENLRYFDKKIFFNQLNRKQMIKMFRLKVEIDNYNLDQEQIDKLIDLIQTNKLDRYYDINSLMYNFTRDSTAWVFSTSFKQVKFDKRLHQFTDPQQRLSIKDGDSVLIACQDNEIGALNLGHFGFGMNDDDQKRIVQNRISFDILKKSMQDHMTEFLTTNYKISEYLKFQTLL